MIEKISRRRIIAGGAAALLSQQLSVDVLAKSKSAGLSANSGLIPDDLDHEHFMRLAIEQANKVPSCPFGAVVVNMKSKKVVGEGWVRVKKNPIWHGEMTAINSCPDADLNQGFNWREVCLYTTGESCPMCQAAIIWTGMPLVVYGSAMPFLQRYKFGEIDIRAETVNKASRLGQCRIIGGVLEKECNALFADAHKFYS